MSDGVALQNSIIVRRNVTIIQPCIEVVLVGRSK